MGPVSAGVTTATFYNFNPGLVARHIPRAWSSPRSTTSSPPGSPRSTAPCRACSASSVDAPAVGELAGLVRTAADDLPAHGRALFAAHADLPWPDAPHLALWHGITLLREFRGDGHVAALLDGGLSGLEALVTHTRHRFRLHRGGGQGHPRVVRREWAAAVDALRSRGVLDGDGLTPTGTALRDSVEVPPTGSRRPVGRLTEDQLGRARRDRPRLHRTIAANGAWPEGVFGGGRR